MSGRSLSDIKAYRTSGTASPRKAAVTFDGARQSSPETYHDRIGGFSLAVDQRLPAVDALAVAPRHVPQVLAPERANAAARGSHGQHAPRRPAHSRNDAYNCPPQQKSFPGGVPVSDEDLKAELERLRAENEQLKKSARGKLAMKVSEKGALSVYGMGRFPVTLYKEQWLRLLSMADEIKAFIEANQDSLKSKE
jgi:hypothetical protein